MINNVDTLITDVRIAGQGEAMQLVAIDGGKIVAVDEMGNSKAYHARHTLHRPGHILLPGLINTHTHIPMTLLRGVGSDLPLHNWLFDTIFPLEEGLDEEAVYWGSMLGILELLRGGTTQFFDMYFMMESVAKAIEDSGIRGMLTCGISGKLNENPEKITNAKSFVKEYQGFADGRVNTAMCIHAEYTTDTQMLQAAHEASVSMGVKFNIHACETKDEVEGCIQRHGVTPVGWLNQNGCLGPDTIVAHGVVLSDEDIALLAQSRTWVSHCPASNLKLASGIAPLARLLSQGVQVCLGTDGAASNNRQDMWREMYLAAVLHKGMTQNATVIKAQTALDLATICGAKALGKMDTGAIIPGNVADLVLVNALEPHLLPTHDSVSTLVYSAEARDVAMTMVNGNILYLDGSFPHLDVEKICVNAQNAANRLHQRAKV